MKPHALRAARAAGIKHHSPYETAGIVITNPVPADAAQIHELISRCRPLDVNSTYAYLLLCHHHADTCVVARSGNHLVGFISGYVLPRDPDTLFVWQVAVHPEARGARLGARMLEHLMKRESAKTVHFMETTVSPSNAASRRMFQRFACLLRAAVEQEMLFDRDAFGQQDHEEEVLLKIGPFDTGTLREVM
ncbi:MAG: diaminobutyrate acetyltransferase [Betaproteobacteria bacterium]|nr:MAG: diaminobutyrate acetyltransferase [Betaproteobacteria bacterium]